MGVHAPIPPATRAAIEAEIERLIDLLDTKDGDPDSEDNTDQEGHDGDDQGDISWPEWHTRDWRTRRNAGPNSPQPRIFPIMRTRKTTIRLNKMTQQANVTRTQSTPRLATCVGLSAGTARAALSATQMVGTTSTWNRPDTASIRAQGRSTRLKPVGNFGGRNLMPEPRLLVGISAIATHSGITETLAQQLISRRALPVWHCRGRPMATATALEEWRHLRRTGKF